MSLITAGYVVAPIHLVFDSLISHKEQNCDLSLSRAFLNFTEEADQLVSPASD